MCVKRFLKKVFVPLVTVFMFIYFVFQGALYSTENPRNSRSTIYSRFEVSLSLLILYRKDAGARQAFRKEPARLYLVYLNLTSRIILVIATTELEPLIKPFANFRKQLRRNV